MVDHSDNLFKCLKAIKDKKYDDAIAALSDIISNLASDEKERLTICYRYRALAYFELKNYERVTQDCKKLKKLGFRIHLDEELATIEPAAEYRVITATVLDKLKMASTNSKSVFAEKFYMRLESVNNDELFDRDHNTSETMSSK